MPITQKVELIGKKKFAKAALDEYVEAFVVHVAPFTLKIIIHPTQKAQIALLLAKEIIVLAEYTSFANIFSEKLAVVLPEQTSINEHTIKLVEGKQPPFIA